MSDVWASRIVGEGEEAPDQLLANPQNYRRHPKTQLDALEGALEEIGWIQRVIVNQRTGHMIDGHARVELSMKRNEPQVPVLYVDLDEREEKIALAVLDPIAGLAYHDEEVLADLLSGIETDNAALAEFLNQLDPSAEEAEGTDATEVRATLAEQYLVPPFSILDARQKYWADRKRTWLALGIRSEKGRGQDGEKAGQGGLTFSVSAQPGHVLDRKQELEKRDGKTYTWAEFAEQYPEEITLGGDSIFDPVLTEISYRWFAQPGGKVLDPFAGGSVRGVVAAMLGYQYTGLELRGEQVQANRENWLEIRNEGGRTQIEEPEDNQPDLTPVETHGNRLMKRDDLYCVAGVRGGKVRACWNLAQGATGLVTAGSRQSPQVNIVANIAKRLGIPARVHVPKGELTPELRAAEAQGAEIIQHKAGYNSVIIKRAHDDAEEQGFREIPFGMESEFAVRQTAEQVANLPWGEFDRIVIPVGSGMNLAGLLHGLKSQGQDVPVLGVKVGADPTKRLDKYAPKGWKKQVKLIKSGQDYHDHAPETVLEGVQLDPVYEAKCIPFLKPRDLLWVVGIRQTARQADQNTDDPTWIQADSRQADKVLQEGAQYDLVFSCPPYADLEVYSDDPNDISNMDYDTFIDAYREIIAKATARLKENRFAVFVVGDVRDKKGFYRNFVGDTVQAFEDAGLRYYNEAILITPTGSLAMRAGKLFRASRKLAKAHQNVLVFSKGSPEKNPIRGLGNYIASEFEQHRQLLEAYEKVLVFAKGNPKTATEELGPALTAEPEAVGENDA